MEKEQMEEYWSSFPDTYDTNQEYVVGNELLGEMKKALSGLSALGNVVEFGCGTGYFTETVAQKATQMIATDLSDALLERAKQRLNQHPKLTIQKENCTTPSFPSEKFDTVFMANLIHVIEFPLKALQESHRILKTGGKLIIVTYTKYGMHWLEKIRQGGRFLYVWGKPPKHMHAYSPDSLASLIERAGFTVEKSELIGEKSKALFMIGKK